MGCHVANYKLFKNGTYMIPCSNQSIDSYIASSCCHIVLAFQVLHLHGRLLYILEKTRNFLHFVSSSAKRMFSFLDT